MTALEYLCHMETVGEIIRATGEDMALIAMRWDGMTNEEIASVYDITHQAVAHRLKRARKRIAWCLPDVAPMLEGRQDYGRRRMEVPDVLEA